MPWANFAGWLVNDYSTSGPGTRWRWRAKIRWIKFLNGFHVQTTPTTTPNITRVWRNHKEKIHLLLQRVLKIGCLPLELPGRCHGAGDGDWLSPRRRAQAGGRTGGGRRLGKRSGCPRKPAERVRAARAPTPDPERGAGGGGGYPRQGCRK